MSAPIMATRADIAAGKLKELRERSQATGAPLYVELGPFDSAAELLGSALPEPPPATVRRTDHAGFLKNLDNIAAGKVRVE